MTREKIICEGCRKPILRGQFVHCYEDVGEVHVDCDRPDAFSDDPMACVLVGDPMRRAALSRPRQEASGEVRERMRTCLGAMVGQWERRRECLNVRPEAKKAWLYEQADALTDTLSAQPLADAGDVVEQVADALAKEERRQAKATNGEWPDWNALARAALAKIRDLPPGKDCCNQAAVIAAEALARPDRMAEMEAALRDIAAERRRQIDVEGWTPEHDDEHSDGAMAKAAACYADQSTLTDEARAITADWPSDRWPWDRDWWKPKDRRTDLIRAGALIAAEIERLDRAALSASNGGRDG